MDYIVHKAESRGFANHGWLVARHSFSFSNYYNPEKVHFGVLRVLNDDIIAPGQGFGTHPHDNMEIITIPLKGSLEHKDSMGYSSVIKAGEVQVMSAGTGIYHSEFNASHSEELNLFQIWLFPIKKNVQPRYQQLEIKPFEKQNEWFQILSPSPDDQGVWIHQNAWFYLGYFESGVALPYILNNTHNGIYLMVIEGEVSVAGQNLTKRDAIAIQNATDFELKALQKAKVLLMEIPMQ